MSDEKAVSAAEAMFTGSVREGRDGGWIAVFGQDTALARRVAP